MHTISTILYYTTQTSCIANSVVSYLTNCNIKYNFVCINKANYNLLDVAVLKPNLIILDTEDCSNNIILEINNLRIINKNLPIPILTNQTDSQFIIKVFSANINGFILKDNWQQELAIAIQKVLNNEMPISTQVLKKILALLLPPTLIEPTIVTLTPYEKNILHLLANGLSYKMIAVHMGISINTVRFHLKNIYNKMQVHSATEAVALALKNGMVQAINTSNTNLAN
jgi:DNA-binding NarL/FixJ family response regulator